MNPGLAALVSKPIHHGEEALVAKEFIQGQSQRILKEYRIVIRHTEVVDVWDDALACVVTYAGMYVCMYSMYVCMYISEYGYLCVST